MKKAFLSDVIESLNNGGVLSFDWKSGKVSLTGFADVDRRSYSAFTLKHQDRFVKSETGTVEDEDLVIEWAAPGEGEHRSDPTGSVPTAEGREDWGTASIGNASSVVDQPLGGSQSLNGTQPEEVKASNSETDDASATPAPQPAGSVSPSGSSSRFANARSQSSSQARHTPTGEQQAILDVAHEGFDVLVVEAGAGTGKTSTLRMLVDILPGNGQYTAFNKALRYDQPVATPCGWKKIGDLKVGNSVIGLDGEKHKVIKVIDRGIRPMNVVKFSDGVEVVADDEHLWSIERTHAGNNTYVHSEVCDTGTIARYLAEKRRVSVPTAKAVNLPAATQPVDPWLLGALLGDGSMSNGRVCLCSADQWIFDQAAELLPEGVSLRDVPSSVDRSARLAALVGDGRSNALMDALREIEVYGLSTCEKLIPPTYLWASVEQRLAILQGLMDTDGCPGTVTPIFTSTSQNLAEGVAFLTRSLGGAAAIRVSHEESDGMSTAYQVTVRLPNGLHPFRLPKKMKKLQVRTHDRLLRRRVISVTPTKPDRAICIAVDANDRLFLTAGLVPTHNSLVTESKAKFAGTRCECNTSHSLAFRAVGKNYSHRLNSNRVRSEHVANMLGISGMSFLMGDRPKVLSPAYLASQVMGAVKRFCQSADAEISRDHFKYLDGIDAPSPDGRRTYSNNEAVADYLLPFAQQAWTDICNVEGQLPFAHDHYVKIWERNNPVIAADYILLDESQDSAPVLLSIIKQQVAKGTPVILVGDENQIIYQWRGCVNAAEEFPTAPRRLLSQSFRFGPAVADLANKVLADLSQPTALRLKGLPSIPSRIIKPDPNNPDEWQPTCVLCRTNAAAVATLLGAMAKGQRAFLIGGSDDVISFVEAARDLQQGRSTTHPDLGCFNDWNEVEQYAKTDEGEDLRLMVKLIKEFGAQQIIDALKAQPEEKDADLVISTAHKSKGREWDKVQLAGDFPSRDKSEDSDLRLLYVAVTRAKLELDISRCPFFTGKEGMSVEDVIANQPRQEAKSILPPAPVTRPAATEYTWSKVNDKWCARGPKAELGTIVKVVRRDGSSQQKELVKVVAEYSEATVYQVR